MSLIHDLDQLKNSASQMQSKVKKQQIIYFKIISGLVKLHQKHRVAKNYAVSDELRQLLNSVGVKITQGTDGYQFGEIPLALRGRQIDDTWQID